jgi:hypothetical protein
MKETLTYKNPNVKRRDENNSIVGASYAIQPIY